MAGRRRPSKWKHQRQYKGLPMKKLTAFRSCLLGFNSYWHFLPRETFLKDYRTITCLHWQTNQVVCLMNKVCFSVLFFLRSHQLIKVKFHILKTLTSLVVYTAKTLKVNKRSKAKFCWPITSIPYITTSIHSNEIYIRIISLSFHM